MRQNHPTMLVVGLDGASWNLIDGWIETGDLPTFKCLKERSCWGSLESSIPPVTFPAWRCYSTGKNPGKLGVFWWQHIDIEKHKVIFSNSRSFKSRDVWNYLNDADIHTGIIGMPGTFPPSPVKGFMVAGGPEAHSKEYVYPSSLEHQLNAGGYRVHPPISGPLEAGSPLIKDIIDVIRMRFQIAQSLLAQEPVPFLQVTTFYLNMLQHYFYQDEPVKRAWQLIDEELAKMWNDFDYVLVLSDHGTAPMKRTFFINVWLEKEGYLHRKSNQGIANYLFELGINKTSMLNMLRRLRLAEILSQMEWVKRLARRFIPDDEGLLSDCSGKATIEGIDWSRTKAVGLPQGPLYINRAALLKGEYEPLRKELITRLEALIDRETGECPIEKVYLREDLFQGEYVESAPDIIVVDKDAYHNRGGIGKRHLFQMSNWRGNNARYGLFMISGPGLREGYRMNEVTIYDLCPTILYLMGVPIPADLDGRIITKALANA